jgi:NADH-quinone oxidoreductase subunit M
MLAAAVATGVLAASEHHASINFTFTALAHMPLSRGSQEWIFLCFAVAFLVKMPLVPFHGWLAEAYKSMPIPAVAVFSGVLSKVAAYGFLAIVLPLFPQATQHYQTLMLLIALVAIFWATAVAYTTKDSRLVIAYSSVAQLAFITLGIFSLKPDGGQGALLQMVNHGLVTAAAFFIIAALAARAGGSENLDDMGGIAFRAPVLATLFLIVSFANLAMPGSSNFIGEFMILLGVFQSKLAIAIVASVAVIGAAFYALRLFIAAMHNRSGRSVRSFEIGRPEAIAIVPLVIVILVLAFYPQFGLKRSESSLKATLVPVSTSSPASAAAAAAAHRIFASTPATKQGP